jgi:hypothetical protein
MTVKKRYRRGGLRTVLGVTGTAWTPEARASGVASPTVSHNGALSFSTSACATARSLVAMPRWRR